MVLGREWVDDRDPQGADAVDVGLDDVELARFDEAAANAAVEFADLLRRGIAKLVRNVAEHHDVALRLV